MPRSTGSPPAPLIILLASLLAASCGGPPEGTEGGGADAPVGDAAGEAASDSVERGPRTQPGTEMGIYAPSQHPLYDGRFIVEAGDIYQVGTLDDSPPWDHMGDDAANVRPVEGRAIIDVNEVENSGTFTAELDLPEGRYVIELEEWVEFSPCQDGGIAAYLFEHGDSGCGDSNWPKSLLYVAGWGTGSATLDGDPLYEDYQIHFMVTQGMRDRETLRVAPPDPETEAGSVNPAAMQVDFYIRSPEESPENHPGREVFDHFFAMETTWR